jgi:hypothetical protein
MKSLFFTVFLIGSTVFAAQSQLQCDYQISPGNKESIIVNPNGTYVSVTYGNFTQILVHPKDFDIVTYIKYQILDNKIVDGVFYGVRRDDGTNVIIKATTGEIVNGQVTNVTTMKWDFGAVDNSIVITSPEMLGNLTCNRSLK